jgi:biopolymer transport protein ExbB
MGKRLFVWMGMVTLGLALSALCAAQNPSAQPAVTNLPAEIPQSEGIGGQNFLELLQKGGPVMYPLYVCSILMVAFWIERIVSLRRRRVIPDEVSLKIQEATDSHDPAVRRRLMDEIGENNSPMGRIIKAGLRKLDRPALELEKAIEDAGGREMTRMQRNNKVLSSVASIAPLLGLLGTVTGLMRSFMTVATNSEALGRTELLAAGIYEALVATAVGLSIAIPSMALYFYYQERVDKLVGDIDDVAVDVLEKLFSDASAGGAR